MEEKTAEKFLDRDGRVKQLPKKRETRLELLSYIAEKFVKGKDYTEREVNELCEKWHSFGDLFIIRRELVENKLLMREKDGSRYWRT